MYSKRPIPIHHASKSNFLDWSIYSHKYPSKYVYAMHISYGYDNNYVFISAVCVPTIPDRLHYVYIFLVNTNYLALFKP